LLVSFIPQTPQVRIDYLAQGMPQMQAVEATEIPQLDILQTGPPCRFLGASADHLAQAADICTMVATPNSTRITTAIRLQVHTSPRKP
jgi:hypothetical protein